jgi:hypothetical protein
MREALIDIRKKLQEGIYLNEEHVRQSLVCRLLSHYKIGWNIWDPTEVNTEFPPTPTEDKTRIDIALFEKESSQSVFIEVKAVGKMQSKLRDIEMQVRDYNKNNTALFSVITDGKTWRFYYSLTGGEFHQKFFKKCDLIEDDFEDLEQIFLLFFGKENIRTGRAEEQARKYHQSTKEEKDIQDCLPTARRLVQDPPYPSLPQAIAKLIKQQKGYVLSEDKISEILTRVTESKPVNTPYEASLSSVGVALQYATRPEISNTATSHLNPDNPGDLHFTRVKGKIGEKYGNKWKKLVHIGIGLALQRGEDIHSLNAYLPANIKEGIYTEEGYSPIHGFNVSVGGMDANNSAKTLILLARKLECPLELEVSWYGKSPRAGDQGSICWPP